MLGLPQSTETKKLLPKNAIYTKFNMDIATKEKFDVDIKRITIVNEISPNTISISSNNIQAIYVLQVILKNKKFNEKNIILLSKLIPQYILFILEYENESKLAIYHTKLIQNSWQKNKLVSLQLNGLNLDSVWKNMIIQIGNFELEANSLDEQIVIDERQQKMQKQIEQLENKIKSTKQFNIQVKLKQELIRLNRKMK